VVIANATQLQAATVLLCGLVYADISVELRVGTAWTELVAVGDYVSLATAVTGAAAAIYTQAILMRKTRVKVFALVQASQTHDNPEQGVKLLGLLLTGSTCQHMAGRNGLA
jgi:hypothetical protein